jgi:hypothetical protein
MDIKSITPSWKPYERRPTWSIISSRELSLVLNVSLQTINNWKMRGILPEKEQSSLHLPAGNKNYYRISKIRAWLEDRPESDIHWEWARCWMSGHMDHIKTLQQLEYLVNCASDLFGVEKSFLPGDFDN